LNRLEKLTEGQKKVVLCLEKSNRKSYSEIAKATGLSIVGTRKILRILIKRGIVKENPSSPYERFILNKNSIIISRFSFELLKELILPSFLGILVLVPLGILMLDKAFILFLGGFTVFLAQFLYTFWKLMQTEERIEVFYKPVIQLVKERA